MSAVFVRRSRFPIAALALAVVFAVAAALLVRTTRSNPVRPAAPPPAEVSVPPGAVTQAPYQLGHTGPLVATSPVAVAPDDAVPVVPVVARPVPTTVARVGVSLPLHRLDSFLAATGTRPGSLSIYQNWASGELVDAVAGFAAQARGMTLSVTWEPWSPVGNTAEQPDYSDAAIAAGAHDAYLRAYARSLNNYAHAGGGVVTVRLAHEMNGAWYPWGVGANGNTARSYIAMWRHVVSVFRAEQVGNVRWLWAPNIDFDGAADLDAAYPGAAWVDEVGLSGYNWGPGQYSHWRSFLDLYGPSMHTLRALAPGKPLVVAEVACSDVGGDKAAWVRDLFAAVAARPWITSVTWFDQSVAVRNWLIEGDSDVILSWRAGVMSVIR